MILSIGAELVIRKIDLRNGTGIYDKLNFF